MGGLRREESRLWGDMERALGSTGMLRTEDTETLLSAALMPRKGVLCLITAAAVPWVFGCGETVLGGGAEKAGGAKGRVSEETGKDEWLAPGTSMRIEQRCVDTD